MFRPNLATLCFRGLIINDSKWQEVKFLDDSSVALHNSMINIPNNMGGIYTFILKPNIIPDTHLYIFYIGRAKYTQRQNLRKRCKEYLTDNERPKIIMMRELWGRHLYIRYLPLTDNSIIDKLEENLLNSIIPPCNDEIPNKIIKMAKKAAFN